MTNATAITTTTNSNSNNDNNNWYLIDPDGEILGCIFLFCTCLWLYYSYLIFFICATCGNQWKWSSFATSFLNVLSLPQLSVKLVCGQVLHLMKRQQLNRIACRDSAMPQSAISLRVHVFSYKKQLFLVNTNFCTWQNISEL